MTEEQGQVALAKRLIARDSETGETRVDWLLALAGLGLYAGFAIAAAWCVLSGYSAAGPE